MKITFINTKTGEAREVTPDQIKLKRRQTMRAEIVKQAIEKGLCYLVTLTLNPNIVPSDVCDVCLIHRVWDRFLKRLRRRVEGDISFITITERGGGGSICHLHVLMNNCASSGAVQRCWFECGGGMISSVSVVKSGRIKRVAWYISKSLVRSRLSGRLVTTSRDIKLSPPPSESDDWVVEVHNPGEADRLFQVSDEDLCIHGYQKSRLEEFLNKTFRVFDAEVKLKPVCEYTMKNPAAPRAVGFEKYGYDVCKACGLPLSWHFNPGNGT